jgi:hypothetical protein
VILYIGQASLTPLNDLRKHCTQARYESSQVTAVKSFITSGSGDSIVPTGNHRAPRHELVYERHRYSVLQAEAGGGNYIFNLSQIWGGLKPTHLTSAKIHI